ncbi:hypothetical protein BGX27_005083 [Mortierella sp. AM989]|nr:hypothetical protein BGX27_005083 [Mortierella sp. AM989]
MKSSGPPHSPNHDRQFNTPNVNDNNNADNNSNISNNNINSNTDRSKRNSANSLNTYATRSNAIEYLNSTDPSNPRSSILSLPHDDSALNFNSSSNGNVQDRIDIDNSSPSGHFSHYPSQTLSQRFNHDSDSEHDDEHEDSDRTEGDMNPNVTKTKPKAPVKRPPTFDHRYDRCKQRVYLEEEDVELTFTGYRYRQSRLYLYYLLCILSFGIIFLLGRWMPQRYIAFVARKCEMSKADCIVVENEWGQIAMEPIFTKYYGGPIDSVFSPEQMEKPSNDDDDCSYSETVTTGMLHDMRYFDYQYIRFIYNPTARLFMQNSQWKDPDWSNTTNCERGIGRETHQERTMVFGQNIIDVQEKTIGQLLVQEVLHPFYIFQVFSMVLWFADDYYYYAACIFIISTVSVVTELVETKKTMKRMRNMSRFTCNTKVFRSGRWRYIGSEELVPGDVFEITDSDLAVFPCDAVLLTGDCIVNESMLTGESVPVSKIPVTTVALQHLDLSLSNIPSEIARHFLFSGTKIVRARPGALRQQDQANADDDEYGTNSTPRGLAMVVRIGFNTTKGTLIRSMLFPKPNDFQFYRDSFRFIGILAMIACGGFLISTVNFVRMGVPFHMMIVKALDLITIVVPPALPATMSIGTSFAIARLKRSNIFCISPTRVNIGGKINCMCFDKTGTLTEDGLDVLGVQCADSETRKFGEMLSTVEDMQNVPKSLQEKATPMLFAMTTCHSVKSVNGELIGDPLDLKMFDFTQWILEEGGLGTRIANVSEPSLKGGKENVGGIVSTVVRPPGGKQFNLEDMIASHGSREPLDSNNFLELGIIRCFEFVSALRRMSVIVKRLHSPGMDIFVKGAPEVMTDICVKESLPLDYTERLAYYTHHGYRVIACAYKSMPNLNFVRAQRVKREQVESDLVFLGFIVFENKLKPTTAPIVATLSNARIRQVMCTGDNVLTAISVSKECGLINKAREVYTPRFVSGDSMTEASEIVWENTDDERMTLDFITLKPSTTWSDDSSHGPEFPRYDHLMNDYVLAVTGDCFRWMVDYAPTSTLNRMLVKGQIFARMSPDEKHELVEHLQGIGYCVGFCGDGANDCGALKSADVGISLSEAEASVAAPFTSRSNDIGCVVKVIQEGRAALVTSFSCFKYMALYSIIQFTTVSFLYAFASNLGDFQFLYIDLVLILPIAVFMGRTEAYPLLNPKRPTANLVSKKVLTSLIGQIAIQSFFQGLLFVIVRHQPWYTPPEYDSEEKNIECYENTVLFLLSCFQYLLVAIVFSVGPPFRKPMSSNRPFVFITITLVLVSTVMVLFPTQWLIELMQLVYIPFSFRVGIMIMAGVNLGLSLVCEYYLFPAVARWIGQWMNGRKARREIKQHQQVIAPPPQYSLGYGSTPAVMQGISRDVEAGIGYDANDQTQINVGSGNTKKAAAGKKSSVKIYKIVEDEMMGP